MSNKYEREIEEILRNLEHDPKRGLGPKRDPRRPRERRPMASIRLSFVEWCLLIASIAALIAGGWAYAAREGNIITGLIALIGFVFVLLVAFSHYLTRPRYSPSSTRYNNVTSLHRNPLSRLAASWHLLMLKLRYRNRNDRER